MSHVAPHVDLLVGSAVGAPPRRLHTALGFLYVVATGAGTILYLVILSPNVSNDNLWPSMNTTGVQTFLGDLFNAKLTTGVQGPLDLFASTAVVRKDYSTAATFIDMRPAAARAVLLSQLPLATAIHVLRGAPFSENIQTLSMPCWADLNRTYEMAHSASRQARCIDQGTANAALYLEPLFRNLGPNDLATSTYLSSLQRSTFDSIKSTTRGAAWIQAMLAPTWLTIADEVALWHLHGLSYFQNSFQNYYLEGTQESISVVNALGMHQSLTVSSVTATNRPKTQWTSAFAYVGFWNDIEACAWLGASTIRGMPNSFETLVGAGGESWDMFYIGSLGTQATAIIRSTLGPLTSIDVFLVVPPPSLLTLVTAYQDQVHAALVSTNVPVYWTLLEPIVAVAPLNWLHPGALYHGGNPLCVYAQSQPFIQTSFGYYDDCGVQSPHTIQLTRDSVGFATLVTALPPSAVCSLTSAESYPLCLQTLSTASSLADATSLAALLPQATYDVVALNTTFVQFATIDNHSLTLHQPMVSSNNVEAWSFVGWMTMYEWGLGLREVYTFAGDIDSWTLMSCRHDFAPLAASAVELPNNGSRYLWVVSLYVSCVLLFVLSLVLAYAIFVAHLAIDGRHLVFCNRLVGGAWIGRPFLFLRGMTALLVLATSPVAFRSYGSLSKLDFSPRPVWHTLLLAGEVTWITYVANDVLLPATKPHSTTYAPRSSLLAWAVIFVLESTGPFHAHATIGRECTILSFTRGLVCTNGEIFIGSFDRVLLLVTVCLASVPLTYLSVVATTTSRTIPPPPTVDSFHLSGVSEAFLSVARPNDLDVAACLLSGLLPCGLYMFDVKNWIVFKAIRVSPAIYALPAAAVDVRPAPQKITAERRRSFHQGSRRSLSKIRWLGVAGLFYMAGAVVGSFLYLFQTEAYFLNDFLWLGFGRSNTQAFLANWFNAQLQTVNATSPMQMDAAAHGEIATTNNITQINIISSALYAIRIQDEANSLANVVQGLRAMDSCMLPWIATTYCFADFGQLWQMALSAKRQQRCLRHEVDNGAVYLEALFRNANDWPTLSQCWGPGLEVAIFSAIQNTNAGIAWTVSMKSVSTLSIDAEVQAWRHEGITRFSTLWQNYKSLGVTESFLITNYAGLDYPLTLKQSNSSFHLSGATAFKMYSPLATYLQDIASNQSTIAGQSLIRSSRAFACANTTAQTILIARGILDAPLDPALVIFSATVGPFGVVDLKRVAPPENLCRLYRSMRMFLVDKFSASDQLQAEFWATYTQYFFFPQPAAWDPPMQIWAGDINCGLNFGGSTTFPLEFLSSTGICGNYLWDYMKPSTPDLWMAMLTTGPISLNATAVGQRDPSHTNQVVGAIRDGLAIMAQALTPDELMQFHDVATDVKTTLRDDTQLELIQYVSLDGTTFTLSRVNMFTSSEQAFEPFAWLYLFEWVQGKREVVAYHGAVDTLTTISTIKPLVQQLANAIEIPQNVGSFYYVTNFYITLVLFAVGCLVTLYIVSSRGYVDGFNVMAFNYVAGHVWIGRPLMLLRSITSVALLSTSQLKLVTPRAALTSYFESPGQNVLTTLLSSGEICWLVYVIVDTCSVVTQEYTAYYSFPSVVVVSLSVAIWSFASPAVHSVQLARQCTVMAVDFDISCVSGVVRIGDLTRFGGLIGVACGGSLVTYGLVRLVQERPPRFPPLSPLLYSAANTKFEYTTHVNWEHEGVYYLDKASAAMTGVLTMDYRGVEYLIDMKTWRAYIMSSPETNTSTKMPPQFRNALPLDSASIDTEKAKRRSIVPV
ncbi:Aste57867_19947 [Aphanomyces stellatus]|uniref:Aste57867_19947 protein n=1 Tax=Aphanomyces stellatus TaxID=120398 RepID=A0A485LDU4_9STRA|nr:hypothetical protein As57867_019881 [Aphanomyces stellatus]VFT96644.1 Aste57867_19947 [Aphanomyces stellatus]